jgi:hypothetical protein
VCERERERERERKREGERVEHSNRLEDSSYYCYSSSRLHYSSFEKKERNSNAEKYEY